ncbi:hypothetical protein [Paramaledivibacter caminithermalis]|uniref:Ribophorin II N-terminal domain-containing protein n=1 Tax=Paramaledivibacter caminithermalis (strain DSM 15212 / CIP 107654 / DViRD3) TaxID=1121301 RepID=A0A1M6Q8V9_PARC5|nr:hypothetical protein [Paramaledivibacter caminithermalis]SHK16631.1 hypothetical protein SAMN02745912_02479 [Paramaledivibacter caminithermalis DSM 15212]
MKNRIIIVLFICIILATSCSNQIVTNSELNTGKKYQYSKSTINKELLNKMYYENDNSGFFFSNITDQIISNKINYYSISWLFNIGNVINVDFSDYSKEIIMNHFNNIDLRNIEINNRSDLHNLLNRINIEKNIYGSIKNKSYYITELLKHYVREEGLFYINNEFEELNSKIQITNIVLQIFDLLREMPKEVRTNTLIKLQELLIIDDNNFSNNQNEFKKNLIDSGIVILDSLRILDKYTDENLKEDIKKRENWILFWGNELNKHMLKEDIDIITLNQSITTIDSIAKHIGLQLKFDRKYIEKLDFNFIKQMYLRDVQVVYNTLLTYHILGEDIPNKTVNFINSNLKYWIYECPPSLNVKELYFALKLAKKFDIQFNQEKIKYSLRKYINIDKIENIYFLTLIYNELDSKSIENKIVINKINDLIKNFLENPKISTQDFYYLIELYKNFNLESTKFEEVINGIDSNLLEKDILNTNYDKEVYFLVKIAESLDIKIDTKLLCNKIEIFKSNKGIYFHDIDHKAQSIFSTFRMLELKLNQNLEIDRNEKINNAEFIHSLETPYGGYFITLPKNNSNIENFDGNFSFESYYYGVMLAEMLY